MASFNRVHGPQSSVLIVLLAMSLITFASSDYASDRAECADQVIKLSTCLTYMQGSARAPTPDCCSSLKQVVDKSFKCLCILVKDRNEPELASFKVNVTFALRLPSKCGVPANASACPRASDGTASMSTRAGGWRTEAGAGLWSLSLLLLVLLSVLGC
uniref:Protein YLS3 isoform X2 n=1 Tax=Elaeis guineensis var. tenera TaxID=51953 RepID=A0A6I9RYA2_ELAGV|nr:protein YLS3 isoform X2 [Elaeis guineensis]